MFYASNFELENGNGNGIRKGMRGEPAGREAGRGPWGRASQRARGPHRAARVWLELDDYWKWVLTFAGAGPRPGELEEEGSVSTDRMTRKNEIQRVHGGGAAQRRPHRRKDAFSARSMCV